jgi:outer membrane protein assembly factor BamE (lipoprotein component of BamABCDE complex)
MRRTPLALACLLIALSGGCTVSRVYRGTPLRGDPSEILAGASTKSDVMRVLGPPDQITHQTDGDAFVYSYSQQNFSSLTVQEPFLRYRIFTYRRQFENRDRIVVLFDFFGVVREVAQETEVEELPVL